MDTTTASKFPTRSGRGFPHSLYLILHIDRYFLLM